MTTSVLRGESAHTIADHHQHLRGRFQQLQQSLVGAQLSELQTESELRLLERDLDEHFAEEELGGFFTQILADRPEFNQRVQRLVAQHREFKAVIGVLRSTCRLACGESGAREGWLAAFAEFEQCFADHERAEHELLFDATERDLGTGD